MIGLGTLVNTAAVLAGGGLGLALKHGLRPQLQKTIMQAMGMAVGCLSSVGSTMDLFGVADVSVLPAWTKLYCSFLMILGRVEIFSFLVVIQTAFGYLRRRW